MPGSFNEVVTIDKDGNLLPAQHPLALEPGETVLRLDAWVFQGGGACMAFLLGPFQGNGWTLDPNPADFSGDRFQPGGATGMGLMVSEKANGARDVFQWTENITLKLPIVADQPQEVKPT